jgi:hypothetical protein
MNICNKVRDYTNPTPKPTVMYAMGILFLTDTHGGEGNMTFSCRH